MLARAGRVLRAITGIRGRTLAWIPVGIVWLGTSLLRGSMSLRVAAAAVLMIVACSASRVHTLLAAHVFLWPQQIGFTVLRWLVDPARGIALEIDYGCFHSCSSPSCECCRESGEA